MTHEREPWLRLGQVTVALAWESATVIALRSLQIARGRAGEAELRRMVEEKVDAMIELQVRAMTGGLSLNPLVATQHALTHARRRVRANRRRLIRP